MKKSVVSTAVAALGLGFALASLPATAAITWYNPITSFEDDNIDRFIDNDGDGELSIGDRLVSVFEFGSTSGVFAGQGPSPIGPAELTGVSDITVTGRVATGNFIAGLPEYRFTFGATANGLITGGADSVANIAGAMAVLWLDDTPDLNVINAACGTLANCLAQASDGLPNPWLAVGLGSDPDAFWTGVGAASITGISGLAANSKVATINFQLDMLVNNTGQTFGPQPCSALDAANPANSVCGTGDGQVLLIGSGDILGGFGLANGWHARSDTDAQVAPVPEPGTLALLAGALLAGGVASRKRLSK